MIARDQDSKGGALKERSGTDGQVLIRDLGQVDYISTWRAMQIFTARRAPDAADEIWLLEHSPVYTQGQAGKPEHLIAATDIPVVPIDRGGQITYHGPGQVVVYVLIDLRRRASQTGGCHALLRQEVDHGLAFNVDMDMRPFAAINPCGYAGMRVTQCRDLGVKLSPAEAGQALVRCLRDTIYS